MPIGGKRKIGGIGGLPKKGPIGSVGTFTGDSLTTGVWAQRFSRSMYPTTTSSTSSSSSSSSSSSTTTTAP